MTINAAQFREYIVKPALVLCWDQAQVPATPFIHDLLIATAAQETLLGKWLHQVRGPALGVYQIEPASFHDLMQNFVISNKRYNTLLEVAGGSGIAVNRVIFDLRFATVIARLFYYRVLEPLPKATTFDTLWGYYKAHWNTTAGRATEADFERALLLTDIQL